MLVLSRKQDEKVRIILGPDVAGLINEKGELEIIVTVVRTDAKQMRLGFEADSRIKIMRGELQRYGTSAETKAE